MFPFFIKGFWIGFMVAFSFGPLSLLCIRRTLSKGFLSGFISGLGISTVDAIYGLIAAGGFAAVVTLLHDYEDPLRFIGGCIMLYYAGTSFRAAKEDFREIKDDSHGLLSGYLSMIALTMTNPTTILFFLGILTANGLEVGPKTIFASGSLMGGVFIGGVMWWSALCVFVSLLREHLCSKHFRFLNHLSALIFLGFGVKAILSILSL